MTYVHTLRGSNSTLCTFVEGESHRGDAYTKGEKTFFFKKTLFYFMLVFSLFYGAFDKLCCSHRIVFMCWTCIYPYVIMLYWLHVWIIICFAI